MNHKHYVLLISLFCVLGIAAIVTGVSHYTHRVVGDSAQPTKPGLQQVSQAPSSINSGLGPTQVSPTSTAVEYAPDSSNWKILHNQYSWRVKYPLSWALNGLGGLAPDQDPEVSIQGPNGCYDKNQECGYISIGIWSGSISNDGTSSFTQMSPKEFLLSSEFPSPPDPEKALIAQGQAQIDSKEAYYVVIRQRNFEDYPNGVIMKEIQVKNQGKFYKVTYYETGKNKPFISSLKSLSDWQLNPTFEQILSTLKFQP